MIKVEKDFTAIPSILNSKNREDAFDKNIIAKSFSNGKSLYKTDEVSKNLYAIYNTKCAYCEKNIDDEDKHIEHYRPKKEYYWLAYSWDNLLLSCAKCNKFKGNKFETIEQKVTYKNESYSGIHNLSDSYNNLEKPLLINPEKDNVLDDIKFNREAEIYSSNKRVEYTINKGCDLNRESLKQKRSMLINAFVHNIENHFELFKLANYKGIDRFIPDIKNFIAECKTTNEFYALRYFMYNNMNVFFENSLIVKILNLLLEEHGNSNE
jgi:uncharacterized protein (TIGR02646 family)